ncbi:hypothetical protein INT45_012174 [Circinella minor]|uniref:Uncharacterized protein n=1 Tax=Circinella minor TaxID=1195481 RepID=A0A8H7SCG7_9FUNG|nr:hypothetical protein INT45_012174 [Circinella minor]
MTESDNGSEEFPFDYRTTNDRFQEKLREAQESAINRQIERDIGQNQDEIDLSLEAEYGTLELKVKAAEKEVEKLREKLEQRKKRREYEAGLSKMTPEERADAMELEHQVYNEDDDINDMEVIFDYLIHIGSAPLPTNAADLSGGNFVQPHSEIREKVLNNPKVLEQIDYSHIKLTRTNNEIIKSINNDDNDNTGTVYDQAFTVYFEVLESKLLIQTLSFTVSVDMQVDTNPLLELIKRECDLLGFFRLLIHYAKLDYERKSTFQRLKDFYDSQSISVEQVELDQLKFKHVNDDLMDKSLEVVLTWRNGMELTDKISNITNLCELVKPEVSIQMNGIENNEINNLSEIFRQLLNAKGVYMATQLTVSGVLRSEQQQQHLSESSS